MDLATLAAGSGLGIEDGHLAVKCPLCGGRAELYENGPGIVRAHCPDCKRSIRNQAFETILAGLKRPAASKNGKVSGKLKHAIAYSRHGMLVFPCHDIEADGECSCGRRGCSSAGKHPRLNDWQNLATLEEAQIGEWWHQWPNANIGVRCGQSSGITVLDVDGDEGRATLHELELEHGELPETPIVLTGRGGQHYYFKFEPNVLGKARFAAGLDFRTEGNLVVGVGSVTQGRYEWEAIAKLGEVEIARMPEWLRVLSPKLKLHTSSNGNHALVPIDDARAMLSVIPADDRQVWLDMGMALKSHYGESGRVVWDAWSQNSDKFDPKDQRRTWDSIRFDGAITIGTLIKLAKDYGWIRPTTTGFNGNGASGFKADEQSEDEAEPEVQVIVWEDQQAAVWANEEYLKRPAIVSQLFYAQSISCSVGGKHHGKTTNLRTLALSVARGLPIWGRATMQGHVIYAASGDEVASTRMELLRMGWNPKTDALLFAHVESDVAATPERVLEQLAKKAIGSGTILIILDMLFDFVRISDEMSYAKTREAIGHVQVLADLTKAHVESSHHSPKYLPDVATAATAALGSQGIAARFSPILLSRKWADGLFTIESTMTRDPRGLAIPQTCIELTEDGWGKSTGEFKSWMKWRVYAPRIKALFEGGEPGREMSVTDIADDLDIPRPEAQNALYQMCIGDEPLIERNKRGRSYKYRLRGSELFGTV